MIGIGIDTGGTYTDAVVVDTSTTTVLAKAKALTTKRDLAIGIGNALDALPEDVRVKAERISLSTTLATNACVEGKGGRAKLVIVGTTDAVLHRVQVDKRYGIPFADVLALDFNGTFDGKNAEMPDWDTICAYHSKFFEEADSFGITGLYALNNGGSVERDGAEYLEKRYGKLVVKATDVAASINVMERGATALLNARLVPVIQEFLDAIRTALEERGLGDVPVSVVRSDGSLMSEELARLRPVETILSGPAASVRGAQALAPAAESLVVDIGGTTSDISVFHDSEPVRTEHIRIGGWQTQVGGVAIDTIGLGGDTAVRYTQSGHLELSTRKVMPLCIAATYWDNIIPSLEQYLLDVYPNYFSKYELFYLTRKVEDVDRYTLPERQLLELLEGGPVPVYDYRANIAGLDVRRLESEAVVMRCGMTSTDAMHILGDFDTFDKRASELGAQCLLKSYRGVDASRDEEEIPKLAREIYDLAQKRLYDQAGCVLTGDHYWPDEPASLGDQLQTIFDANWASRNHDNAHFSLLPQTDVTFIGIGAPTHVLLPEAARALNAQCIIPEHAEVANAVGAICSKVIVNERVRVVPDRGEFGVINGYHVYSTSENLYFSIEDNEQAWQQAMEAARKAAQSCALAEAKRRGVVGNPECMLIEGSQEATGAADKKTITLEWTIIGHVEA